MIDDPEHYQRVKAIVAEALERDGEARASFAREACAGDEALLHEVLTLLGRDIGLDALQAMAFGGVDAPPPEFIGPYRIVGLLGEGGMGVVYRAEQTVPLVRTVALKLVRPGMDSRAIVARFEQERQTLAWMDHPHIARVIDAGASPDGRPFFVMELVDGAPITRYVTERALGLDARLTLFEAVCEGVRHAHQKGVIHRDLKPSNILVTERDGVAVPKIIDFGIAKALEGPAPDLTGGGRGLGTPTYMSPEQAGVSAAPVDTRTDVYALGVLLYELLTGVPPHEFRSSTPAEVYRVLRESTPARPSRVRPGVPAVRPAVLADDLDSIALKALDVDPDRRYASVEQLVDDVSRYRRGLPVRARAATWRYRAGKFVRRHRLPVIAAALVALALTGSFALTLESLRQARQERDAAREARVVADATTDFLVTMVGAANPERGPDNTTDIRVRDVLDTAAMQIGETFASQPAVEARLRYEIGRTYLSLDATAAACAEFTKAVDVSTREFGGLDARTVAAVTQLSRCQQQAGDFASASATLAPLLETCAPDPAPDPVCAQVWSTAGIQANGRRNFREAEPYLRRALAADPGDADAPAQIAAAYNLAIAVHEQGRFAEAEGLYEAVLDRARRQLGPESVTTLGIRRSLAILHQRTQRWEQAITTFEDLIAIRTRRFGAMASSVLEERNQLAGALCDAGQFGRCVDAIREVVEAKRLALGPTHPSTLLSAANHAEALAAAGRLPEAIAQLRDTLDTVNRVLPETYINRALYGLTLARLLGRADRWQEAESPALASYAQLVRQQGETAPSTRRAAGVLASIYEGLGRPAEAAVWRAREAEPQPPR